MPGFIPPFDLGTFKPSAASLASWLYEIWQYLQQNPIPNDAELTEKLMEIVPPEVAAYMEEHPATVQSVNGLIGAVVIAYADLVAGSTVPVFRTTTIESTQADLLDAWDEGCRFTVIDDTNVYVMLYSEPGGVRTITLLPCGSGGGGGSGIDSINTTILPDANGNALVNAANLPMASNDATTISAAIAAKTTMTAVLDKLLPVGTIVHLTVSTNPATLYGVGTWEQITGRFLLGAGANLINTVNTYGEMAAGDLDRSAGERGGEPSHTLTEPELPAIYGAVGVRNNIMVSPSSGGMGVFSLDADGGTVHPASSQTSGGDPQRLTMSFGSGTAHNNLPPYEVVYIWKRTA